MMKTINAIVHQILKAIERLGCLLRGQHDDQLYRTGGYWECRNCGRQKILDAELMTPRGPYAPQRQIQIHIQAKVMQRKREMAELDRLYKAEPGKLRAAEITTRALARVQRASQR